MRRLLHLMARSDPKTIHEINTSPKEILSSSSTTIEKMSGSIQYQPIVGSVPGVYVNIRLWGGSLHCLRPALRNELPPHPDRSGEKEFEPRK
ncbi:hypothetical protein TNCT_285091 [Trichonephila clavata]|uniref:Uncharacterized protein n=2 Tax=Trichonephila TaxID=2585208 RepID=A0A8X6F3Q9_TRICU|nr:hypothetical protein TNCT_285091 [Trichonephila clavata]